MIPTIPPITPLPPAVDAHVKQVADAIDACSMKAPWCSGVVEVQPADLHLFFVKRSGLRQSLHFSFPEASQADLDTLQAACQPATFGLGDKDVLDEKYRKAGKMDLEQFAINFNPERLVMVANIQRHLLGSEQSQKYLRLEAYKLNVYGEGAFFKAHKDTPRGANMLGSLVVVFATDHTGGRLLLRHNGKEFAFDSATLPKDKPKTAIAYAAFYSDVEHEVEEVTAGHRVTMTYNIYVEDAQQPAPGAADLNTSMVDPVQSALKKLLANKLFLPRGGLLGFGLQHEYPIPRPTQRPRRPRTALEDILRCLKGADAVVVRVCAALGLAAQLKVLYDHEEYQYEAESRQKRRQDDPDARVDSPPPSNDRAYIACDDFLDRDAQWGEGALPWSRAMKVYPYDANSTKSGQALWVNGPTLNTTVDSPYVAYGNESALTYLYGMVSLLVEVGPSGDRKVMPETVRGVDYSDDDYY